MYFLLEKVNFHFRVSLLEGSSLPFESSSLSVNSWLGTRGDLCVTRDLFQSLKETIWQALGGKDVRKK